MADSKDPKGTGKAFVVLHQVGTAMPGQVVHFTRYHLLSPAEKGLGISIDRLLALGALREATEEEAENSTAFGTAPLDQTIPFPQVPFDARTPAEITPQVALTTGASATDADGNVVPVAPNAEPQDPTDTAPAKRGKA